MKSRIETLIVAAIAAATNFLYFALASNDYFFPDSFTYLEPARNLIRGLGFTTANGLIDTLRTPGYPLLLAGFGSRIVPMIVFQHLLNVALAVAIYRFVMRRLGGRWGANAPGPFFSVDPPTPHHADKKLAGTIFPLLLFGVFAPVG